MAIQNGTQVGDIIIRGMIVDDIESVLEIQNETGLSYWKFEDYKSEIERDDSICFVATKQNRTVIGFAITRKTLSAKNIENKFTSSEIYNIALSKSYQSKGIGQLMLDKVASELKNQGVLEIWLEVRKSNKQAFNFYEKNGFSKQFERKNYYQSPKENACILKLNL